MLAAYCNTRNLGRDNDFGRAHAASELRLLLAEWPGYVGYGTRAQRRVMPQRLEDLVEQGIGP